VAGGTEKSKGLPILVLRIIDNMKHLKKVVLLTVSILQLQLCIARQLYDNTIKPADTRTWAYIPLLQNKRVALVINQTSKVGDSSLLDILLARHIVVKKIFVPEHGFRGNEDAGASIANAEDSTTHTPVISLYGKHKKPAREDLADIDIVVYDLQDVGVRFYTYISTLEYCMEACAQNHKQFMVLDRPDPNGFYVDGPVLEKENKSFVGMQPIPVVYGMTAGEYAGMLAGEQWFDHAGDIDLKVIKCVNYAHDKKYKLLIAPSPNLRTMAAVYAYPSLCFFEGTVISVGRGTDLPFQQYGNPELAGNYTYSFTPKSGAGSKSPPFENKVCYGEVVAKNETDVLQITDNKLCINWLINAYKTYPDKEKFFNDFFIKLCGTTKLKVQLTNRETERSIRKSWEEDLEDFKVIRKKYLLYPDY
jgi:uncharacterized protein YbbC (DUF1343 family)